MTLHTHSMIAGSYSKGKPCSINEGGLQEKRGAGQLQIVALPFREDVQDVSDRKARFYGLCRFTARMSQARKPPNRMVPFQRPSASRPFVHGFGARL
jgi:hypothetical protein